jgi:Asp-tRNA(Asn)/Glu-tRNA(Gln) amidotransferase A subunit family amidase
MAGFHDYRSLDALDLASLIRAGGVSREEVVEAAIARLEAVNPRLNAVIYKDYDRARKAAKHASGPFAGVPFLVKDTNDYAGTPTGLGSKLFQDYYPAQTDTLTQRSVDGGFIVIGRSNIPEFALVGTTESLVYGPARNPFDATRTAGGSSGGAAAAVAAAVVPAAQASDGGGSIRCPAAASGVFGLKPTRARNPSGPAVGELWQSMVQQHVLTRTVRDSAAILDLTNGPEPGDPYMVEKPARPFLEEVGRDPGSLRIALMTGYPDGPQADPVCTAAAREIAALCQRLGHQVEEAVVPVTVEEMFGLLGTVCTVWIRSTLLKRGAERGRPVTAADVEPMTWEMFNRATEIDGTAYYDAIEKIHQVGRRVATFFQRYDVLLTPALASPAVPLGTIDTTRPIAEAVGALAAFCPFTTTFNVTGQPAASIPLCWTPEGLPIGIQLVTRFADEATLFRLAAQLEAERPWVGNYARIL